MELTLHPIATQCYVTGQNLADGDRVVCYLVREATGEVARRDLLASADANYQRPAFVYCRWVVGFKARRSDENPDRALKLTAENLFLTLADPDAEPSAANTPLLQFLALMLERKRILKPRGVSEGGARQIFEHMPSHQLYEIPAGILDERFFQEIQAHLDVLVGPTRKPREPAPAAAAS